MNLQPKWWINPDYDPMQDLNDCKHNINLMIPALQIHANEIKKLKQENINLKKELRIQKENLKSLSVITVKE